MANYCSNSIRFISKDRSKLAVFLRKVYAAFDSRTPGFYNLLVLHGYTNKQIAGMIDRRDAVTHCDTKLSADGFLPGEIQGQRSLVGYSPQGHKE